MRLLHRRSFLILRARRTAYLASLFGHRQCSAPINAPVRFCDFNMARFPFDVLNPDVCMRLRFGNPQGFVAPVANPDGAHPAVITGGSAAGRRHQLEKLKIK